MRDTADETGVQMMSGDHWVATGPSASENAKAQNWRKLTLDRSPLARKIIAFNLLGLVVLMAGVFYLNPFRDSLATQRISGLQTEAALIANVFQVQLQANSEKVSAGAREAEMAKTLQRLSLSPGARVSLISENGDIIASREVPMPQERNLGGSNVVTNVLNSLWVSASGLLAIEGVPGRDTGEPTPEKSLIDGALSGTISSHVGTEGDGQTLLSVASPIFIENNVAGVVAMQSADGEIDRLVRNEREQVLQMFVVAILVSIGLSLVLASAIANPLSDLAMAAEIGRARNTRKVRQGRVRIPDLTRRPDEIGRLSGALRGMVAALYDRIDANEQFAADVAHEIKNPLASLRSAVGTMRVARRADQREKLLAVIDHDVRRLDRLVSDISNASRLDSELVKEDEEPFDLIQTLENLSDYYSTEAESKGVDFVTDLPPEPIEFVGLEARLAQVFVNLITNALSFCEEGDALRLWLRHRENRILVVVEDTGAGIPEQSLTNIFNRFYSERPPGQFGDHSGLGLAISKQIVEAHGGVIWAENIRPTKDDVTSEPLGARFVVGLPA